MNIKLVEIRDSMTCIPAMAVLLRNRTPAEFFLLRRAGYAAEVIGGQEERIGKPWQLTPYVILCKLDGVEAHYDSFDWPNQRTMGTAHRHMIEHWADVESGAVIDVQYILGETTTPKSSESLMSHE